MLGTDIKNKFVEMRGCRGWSLNKISQELQISKGATVSLNRELSASVTGMYQLAMEELAHKFYGTKEARVKIITEIVDRISEELKTRDLSEVPTSALVKMLNESLRTIREERLDQLADGENVKKAVDLLVVGES